MDETTIREAAALFAIEEVTTLIERLEQLQLKTEASQTRLHEDLENAESLFNTHFEHQKKVLQEVVSKASKLSSNKEGHSLTKLLTVAGITLLLGCFLGYLLYKYL